MIRNEISKIVKSPYMWGVLLYFDKLWNIML